MVNNRHYDSKLCIQYNLNNTTGEKTLKIVCTNTNCCIWIMSITCTIKDSLITLTHKDESILLGKLGRD